MSIAPLVFQGISKYSTDFQTIVDRAVSIAQLPVKALQNQQANLITQKLAASNLSTAVADLASAVEALGALGANQALTARSTNPDKVTATATAATAGAYYAITDITSVAALAAETSVKSYGATDQVSQTGILTLTVGSKAYTVDISARNTLAGARDAINALSGAGVSATIITTTGASYLSISATKTGKNAISLADYPPTGGSVNGAVTITAGVNDKLTITTDAGAETLTLADTDATIEDVAQDINTNSTLATATVTVDGDGNKHLKIESRTAGAGAAAAVSGTAVTAGGNQLGLGGLALLTAANPGANTEFKLNGIPVSQTGTVISDLVAGATFTIKDSTAAGETVGITLATDRTKLSSALQDFAAKYNAVASQVNAQIGPSAGLLSGNSIVRDARGAMLALMNHTGGSGAIKSLAALGIELDKAGKMTFAGSTFDSLSDSQVADAFSFLGTKTTGFGGLKTRLAQISDPVTGTIRAQLDSYSAADKRITTQIAAMTDRINNMQRTLQAKLQAADALLAGLESQQSLLKANIQGLNYTSFGKQPE